MNETRALCKVSIFGLKEWTIEKEKQQKSIISSRILTERYKKTFLVIGFDNSSYSILNTKLFTTRIH